MCDVDRTNFEHHYGPMVEAIQNADFIVFDTEFTGLRSSASNTPSLFDTGEERYKKLRRTVTQISPCQIGISLFSSDKKEKNIYTCHTYNIYLFPLSFGPVDQRILCQASSLEFLCKYNFDFNRFIYTGVSYLNNEQEKEVQEHIKTEALFRGLDRDLDERAIQAFCSKVAQWQVEAKEGDRSEMILPQGIGEYIVLNELKQRFQDLWPSVVSGREETKILIRKISEKERKLLESEDKLLRIDEEQRFLNSLLGFTRVFREVIKSKKPIVGHNMLQDLMMWYHNFYKPLPESYTRYKAELHRIFPVIFDTKHMSLQMSKPFRETGFLEQTALGELFKSLMSDKITHRYLYNPLVKHSEGMERYVTEEKHHEAGYDAYMTGCVFLQLCHMYCLLDVKNAEISKLAFKQYLPVISEFANNINIIRASVNHVRVAQPDPPSQRPEWLFFRSKKVKYKFNTSELASMLSRFGTVDIRLRGPNQALVAVGNKWCAKDILRAYNKHDHIKVCKYNMWKHSPIVRNLLWTGAAISGGICLWALLSSSKPK